MTTIVIEWLYIWEEATRQTIFLDQEASKTGVVQKLLLLKGPSTVTAHWVAYQWNLQQTWKWTFLQDGNKMSPNHGQTHSHDGVLWLKTGTCYLPLLLLLLASDESDSVRPHRLQPIRLHHPWDFPGKNTRVGCHFLLQCMKVKSENEGAQSCPTLRDPINCSLPGSSVHGIFQARVLEWGAIAFSAICLYKD